MTVSDIPATTTSITLTYTSRTTGNLAFGGVQFSGEVDSGGGTTNYTVTYSHPASGGTFTVVKKSDSSSVASGSEVASGTTLTLTATPASSAYEFTKFTVNGTDYTSNPQDITVSAATTISATFSARTAGTVTFNYYDASGNATSSTSGTYVGDAVTAPTPASTVNGWTFAGWYGSTLAETTNSTTAATVPSTVPSGGGATYYALYTKSEGGTAASYELVTATKSDWTGKYLIAYSGSVFANGSTSGTSGMGAQNSSVNPGTELSGTTVSATWGDQYCVELEAVTGGYVMKTLDGNYNYQTSNNNGLQSTGTQSTAASYPLSVTFNSSSDIDIAISAGAVFHYNSQGYFRFYKDGGQNNVYLYERVGGGTTYYTTTPAAPKTLSSIAVSGQTTTFTQGDAFSFGGTVTATYSDSTTADVTSSATFSGYNMANTGSQTVTVTYEEGGVSKTATYTITVNAATTYDITLTQTTGGTISSSSTLTGLSTGATAVISATPATGYQLDSWTVSGATYTGTNPITVTVASSPVSVQANFSKINYTITYENTYTEGTIGIAKRSTATVSAQMGDTVDVTVTANDGYVVGNSITVTDTTNNVAVSTTQSGNVFTFTMPAGNVTVASNANTFTVNPTYSASFIADGIGVTFTGTFSGHAGDSITLPSAQDMEDEGYGTINYFDGSSNTTYTFAGWAPVAAISTPTGTQPTGYIAAGGSYTFGSADVTFRAIYVGGGSGYTLITTAPSDWSGEYIIVAADANYAANGTITSGQFGATAVTITSDTISNAADSIVWVFESVSGGYSLKNKGTGTYAAITGSDSTSASMGSSASAFTISAVSSSDTWRVAGTSGRFFSYYSANTAFRTYSGTSAGTRLYGRSASYLTEHTNAGNACTVTFYDTDNTTELYTHTFYEGQTPSFEGTDPTKAASGVTYYTFEGWNTTANQSTAVTITAIGSSESTRAYYPAFSTQTATVALTFSGRTKVATEGSYVSTTLTPTLTATPSECTATLSSLSVSGGDTSIATYTTTGNVLTVTGVSAGTVTYTVTATYDGGATTQTTVTVTVISGSGGAAGGYKLITKANTAADVSDYDWTGEYIFVAREYGTSEKINTWKVMSFNWTDATTATVGDGTGGDNITGFTLDPATADEFGVATATTGGVTISALHTGEADYTENPTTTGQGLVFDRITGFSDGTNDITNQYVLVFERVDEVNNYYTIRIKGTNYYLTNSATSGSGENHMGGTATPDSIGATLLWKLSWAPSVKPITASATGDTTATPDVLLIESVQALNNSASRAIFYNQAGNGFRAYGSGAYGNLINNNSSSGYNVFLYGKNNPFVSEINYDGTPRNTTDAKIEVPWNYATQAGNSSLLLEGALVPETYPGWTILNSSIPTWNLVGAYNPDGTTFSSATSISAISGTQNANFNVANWTANDVGKYYVVRVNYQVQDPDGVIHDVPQQAMIVVTESNNTYTTVLHEATSQNNTGSWTVPSRIGSTGVDLDAYVRDNYSTIYTDREEVNGLTASQPTTWTYTSQKGYTYTISAAGVVTWDPAVVTQDDVVEIKATAGLSGAGTTATVAEGSYVLYIKQLAYSGEVQATPDSSVTTIPYADTAFGVTLGNFKNNNNEDPGSTTYSINAASEWTWTAATLNGTTVPVTKTSTGATLDVTGLATGTQVIVRATNVIATSNVVANTHTVVTITGKIFTIGEDNSLAAVNDSFVLDFDRNAVLNVMANDRNTDGATITAIGGDNASMAAIGTGTNAGKITFTVPGGLLASTYTFTYTLSKSGETDSTATVTVKPATAIYYEDNNSLFTYTDGTQGKWTDEGSASDWTQDADPNGNGYDANVAGLTYSLGRVKKANVGNSTSYGTSGAAAKWPTMTFTFVGNAFEIDTFRDADAGMFRVTVDGTKYNVSTAYGATYDDTADEHAAGAGWTYDVAGNYYGMPVFVWGDPSSTATATSHTVTVQVLYTASFDYASPAAGNYDVLIDGVKIYNPNVGGTTYKYISFRDTVIAAGTLGVPTTEAHSYIATLTPTNLSVGVGYTGQLSVSLTDNGQTVSNTGYTVSYASDDANIATVDASSGLITGVAEGTATITATITPNGGAAITKTCVVNVTNTVYTVTYKLPNGDQTVTYTDSSISLGSGVTHLTAAQLAEYNAHNYVFRGWASAAVADTTTQPATLRDDGASVTLTGDATYYAVYRYGTTDSDFALKTDLTNPLVNGETIVIYETEGSPTNYLLSNADYSSTWNKFRLGVAAAPANGIVTTTNSSLYWEVVATTGGFLLMDEDGNYLTATDTDGQLVMTGTPDAKAIWNATTTGVTGTNSVFIYNSENSPKYLQHYSGYPEFGAYTYDEAWANRNEMQIYVQQANASYYTTDLQSTTVRYTVNYYVNGTATNSEQVVEGGNPSFPNVTGAYTEAAGYSHDYTFLGWIPEEYAEDTTTAPATVYTTANASSYTVNAGVSFHAVFTYTGAGSAAEGYTLSSSAPEAGDTVIIAIKSGSDYYALPHGATAASTWSGTAITLTNGAVADTTDLLWDVEATNNSSYPVKLTYGSSKYFKLNSSQLAYTGDGATGYMNFTASGDGFTMENSTPRYLAQSSAAFGVTSNSGDAATVYIFKYSSTGGSQSYYATTLGEATPITHSYAASITPTSLALHPGETGSVTATLTDNGSAVAGATPTYTTSLSSVATVAADGTVTAVANGNATITATYTVDGTDYTATCDVAVTTLATYNVTYMVNGSQYGEIESVVQGNSPSFTAPSYDTSSYNAHNYEFLGWKEGSALSADTTETQTLYVAGNSHVISANTTYYAVYRYVEGGSALTAVTQLNNGGSAQYVIAANVGGTYYAMSNTFASKIDGTSITNPGSSISASNATGYAVTIEKSASGYTIKSGSDYLTYSSSTNLGTSSSEYYWSIATASTHGSYHVTSVNTTDRGLIYRAGTTNKFGGYSTGNVTASGEYYDLEIIPVGSSGTTYYATTLNVAAAHNYVASISPSSVTLAKNEDTYILGTLTDNGITTTAYPAEYTSSNSSVVLVDENTGYVLAAGEGTATVTVSYDVNGDIYSAVCNVTVTAATVVNSYSVTYKVNGSTYDVEAVDENGHPDFATPTTDVSAYDAHSYSFIGWAASTVSETTTSPTMYTSSNASSYTVIGDVTFHAVYTWSEGGSGSGSGTAGWTLVTDASTLKSGDKLVLAESSKGFTAGDISSSVMSNITSTFSSDKSSITSLGSNTVELTLGGSSGEWTFSNGTSLLGATAAKKLAWGSGTTTWSISIASDGAATIENGTSSYGKFLYNVSSPRFTTYTSSASSSMILPQLYRYSAGSTGGDDGTNYYTTTLEAQGTDPVLTVSPTSLSMSEGGYAEISVTAANGGANAYVTATSSATGVANVYALNDGNNTYGVTAGSAGSATITITYYDSSNTQLVSKTVSVTVSAAGSGSTGATDENFGRVGSEGNAPTTSGSTNKGTRGVVATSISNQAKSYYETNSVNFNTWNNLAGVNSTNSAEAANGNSLRTSLGNLMKSTLTTTVSYSSLTGYWATTDRSNNASNANLFYSCVTSSSYNREHVWPKSKGQFYESGAGSDLHHLRPSDANVNSSRGNLIMADVNPEMTSSPSTYSYSGNVVLWKTGNYVEPLDQVKGDVARIFMYVYTTYPENTNLFTDTSGGGSGNNASNGERAIYDRATLLKWCKMDPVDTWEMSRNDACESIQHNRNVFIDYPELVWMVFGLNPPTDMATPSGKAAAGVTGRATDTTNYGTSAVGTQYATMGAEPVVTTTATRSIATRTVGDTASDLPVTGAVMVDAQGTISNNDDVVSYLENYGAKNCLIVPVNGAVVFYLNNGADGTEVAIGANAINGTATTLKVYQITEVGDNTATGKVLLEQAIASSTEMYYKINGITWIGDKTNVLMVRNEGSAPMIITNLRATGNPDVQISTRAIHQGIDVSNLEMVIDNETITAAVAAMNALNEGTFGDNDTPIIPITTPVAVLTNASLSLDGLIGVNFYVTVPSTLKNSGYYFTINGEKVALEKVAGASTAYRVTGRVAAKEMNDLLELKFFDKNGNEQTFGIGSKENKQNSFTYTVREYLEYVEENADSFDAKVLALCSAMSDYGSYAQTYFNYDKENAAAIQNADAIAAVTVGDEYGYTYDDDTAHITYYGPSVVTESETAIRIYFKLSGDIDDYSVTVNGKAGEFVAAKGMYYVEISNIAAKDLGKGNTVTVTYGDEKLTVSGFSVYTYVRNQLNNANATDALKNAVKALKFYGDAAANYFKEEN